MSTLQTLPTTVRRPSRRTQPTGLNTWAAVRLKLVVFGCAIISGLLVAMAWLPIGADLEFTPDSHEYMAIAENLAGGRGYRHENGDVAVNRSPLYPVLLASVVHRDPLVRQWRTVAMHRSFAFVIGFSLVLYGHVTIGGIGTLCALLTSILISGDDELGYAAVQVLTELPATAFLCLSLLAVRWTSQGSARRELLMAALQIGLFLTRSALVSCGVAYGIYLVFRALQNRSTENIRRVALFGLPCAMSICLWSWFLWAQTGQVVLLTSTGLSNMAAGLSPETVAASMQWPVPHSDHDLENFWTGAPPVSSDVVVAAVRKAIGDPMAMLHLTVVKFKIAFHRTPVGAFYLGVFGAALQLCFHLREVNSAGCSFWRRIIGQSSFGLAFCSCSLAICGFSMVALKVGVIMAALGIVLCRVSPVGRPYGRREDRDPVPRAIAMVCGGFVLMTLISFGLPRFTRPFLPALYLSATLCLPLASSIWNQQSRRVSFDTPTV